PGAPGGIKREFSNAALTASQPPQCLCRLAKVRRKAHTAGVARIVPDRMRLATIVPSRTGSALLRAPAGRRNDVDHPRDAEPVDQGAETGRPEGLAERHDRLAAFRQLVEPALGFRLVAGVQGNVEAVLGLVDVAGPFN